MLIEANHLNYYELNQKIRESDKDCTIKGCIGQRFIAAGMGNKDIVIEGIPGNALGAYLSGANITVKGNAQDAVGDTMNRRQKRQLPGRIPGRRINHRSWPSQRRKADRK